MILNQQIGDGSWKTALLFLSKIPLSPAPIDLLKNNPLQLQAFKRHSTCIVCSICCGECRWISCFNSAVVEILDDDRATFYELLKLLQNFKIG